MLQHSFFILFSVMNFNLFFIEEDCRLEQIALDIFLTSKIEEIGINARKVKLQVYPTDSPVLFNTCYADPSKLYPCTSNVPKCKYTTNKSNTIALRILKKEYNGFKLVAVDQASVEQIRKKVWILTVNKAICLENGMCYVEINLTGLYNSYYYCFEFNHEGELLRCCKFFDTV